MVIPAIWNKTLSATGYNMNSSQNATAIALPSGYGLARANNFDFLRVTLATLVIFSHSCQLLSGQLAADPLYRLMHSQMSGGALAVNFFFVLSGFLVVKSWEQSRTSSDFARKRFLRIYPGFAMVLAFCVFIVGPLGGANLQTYFTSPKTYKFFEMLLLRPNSTLPQVFTWLPNSGVVNASLWTIRFELICYIAVLVLGIGGVLTRRTLLLIAFILAYTWFNRGSGRPLSVPFLGSLAEFPRLITYFLSGAVFYLYRDLIPHSRKWLLVSVAALAASHAHGLSLTLPIFGTYTVFYAAFSHTFRMHHVARWGDFSYGLYLYAYPVQQLLVQHFGTATPAFLLFVLSFAITLALAVLSWHFVERPCLRLKPRPQTPTVALLETPSLIESPPAA
jgi:peptidoglycan/LPS O-acetylase OafA/YrhL